MERSYANLYTLKADKATTLSGYGITDSYTKLEVDTKFTNYAPVVYSATAPTNTKLLWIDSNKTLNFYNTTTSAWEKVASTYV